MGKYMESRVDVQHAKQATLRIILSFLASIPLYAVVIFFMFPPEARSDIFSASLQTVPAIIMLAAIALATALVLFFLPGRSAPERLAEQGLNVGEAIQTLLTSYSIRCAVIEALALIGFVLSILNQQLPYFLVGGMYALVMFLLLLVRRASEFEALEKHFKP